MIIGNDIACKVDIDEIKSVVNWLQILANMVRRKFDGSIETKFGRIMVPESLYHQNVGVKLVFPLQDFAPSSNGLFTIRDEVRTIENEEGTTTNPDIARIIEMSA